MTALAVLRGARAVMGSALDRQLLPIIKRVMAKHPLKAADSVHLSSALWLAKISNVSVTFVASDANLLQAAKLEDIGTINPEET
ncbi:MAG TPA: hypothetical protein VKF36_01235 [Syntrophorhabdales bacterium]|nr:hypothetical protein [Syntrophorhabdales bacterium]